MKKVLLPQIICDEGLEVLKDKVEVIVAPDPSQETLLKTCTDADAIILRTTSKVTEDVINAAKNLKIVSRTGAGVDNVDVRAATKRGILVCNLVDVNSLSVCEHAIALMLALAKQLPFMDKSVRQGFWKARNADVTVELENKTLGIIALGSIGSKVAKKCHDGLGMKILAFDPYAKNKFKDCDYEFVDSLKELFKRSDFISVHCPNLPETKGMITRDLLFSMKPDAYFINTSRGVVVDEQALIELLREKRIAGAGLDVFTVEPLNNNELLKMENVILSPHVAALTREATIKMAVEACRAVVDFFNGKLPRCIFNRKELNL
jgi:D-3-phosphoglycerate dehydrogenase / 2-oxoglutarate reductase